jgi:membrane protease YdiL (CAAX protease family)
MNKRATAAATYVVGTSILSRSLAAEPGSPRFLRLTFGMAATWITGGLLARGPRQRERTRPVGAVLLGVGAFGVFYVGARICRHIPFLRRALSGVLRHAYHGSSPLVVLTTLVNGVAEEVYFRGAVYDLADRPVTLSTVAYIASVAASRNPALILASAVMGTLFTAQRHASGDITSSMITHVVWSTLMLRYVTPLFTPATPSR